MKIKKLNLKLIGGISGLIIGGAMIFIWKDNLGFLPAILGALYLIRRKK